MLLKNKKIVFTDGDGTLWYPRRTKRQEPPHLIYREHLESVEYLKRLQLIPGVLTTLKKIRKMGLSIVLLSTHPVAGKVGDTSLLRTVKHFNLEKYFYKIHSTEPKHETKGQFITATLKQNNIFKSSAIMIGDNYFYDYQSARRAGVDAVLIDSPYVYKPRKNMKRIVTGISDLI